MTSQVGEIFGHELGKIFNERVGGDTMGGATDW